MKLIFRIFLKNENLLKHMLIFIILLIAFFTTSTFCNTLSNLIHQRNNSYDNKRIRIILNEDASNVFLKNNKLIEKIGTISENEYELIFYDYKKVTEFVDTYNDSLTRITYYGDSKENKTVLTYINLILKFSNYIILTILGFIIILCLYETFLSLIEDFALFKLIGMKDNLIITFILSFYFFIFTSTFFGIYLFYLLTMTLLKSIFSYFLIKINIIPITFNNVILLYFIIILLITIINIIFYNKIKRISPIDFIKKNTQF